MTVTGTGGQRCDTMRNCWARGVLLAFAWLNVCLGVVGVVVRCRPTPVFASIATSALSKGAVGLRRVLCALGCEATTN